MSKQKLLIFGARKKSIGQAISKMWSDMTDGQAVTAGVSGEEEYTLSLEDAEEVGQLLKEVQPTRIVVTVGMNKSSDEYGEANGFEYWMHDHWHTNVFIPMGILMTWLEEGDPGTTDQFVAMSSNSAVIPRSRSLAYCSSKAALSMALRCAARDLGKAGIGPVVYGYEPGLVRGTPMSAERAGTRMLGLPDGMGKRTLASHVVGNMLWGGKELNGTLLRIDAGEV